jgi:hypothetical protein
VGAAKAGDEMVFESLDGVFGPVAMMEAGRSQLVVDVFIGHEVLEKLRGFVVEAMEPGTEATALEKAKNCFVGGFDGGLFAVGYWLSVEGVAVIIVEDKDVVVATGGRHDEATGLVGAYLASDGLAAGVDVLGAFRRLMKDGLQRGLSC